MKTTINTTVKLKMSGFKPFNKTEKKPAGVKIQSRYTREEGGLSQFEIKVYELNELEAKALKGKALLLENCSVFRPDQEYAPSYWNSLSKPLEIKESIDKPIINTIVNGTVEAVEPFIGEKMSGCTLFFIDTVDDAENIVSIKVANLLEADAKALLQKDVSIEQCKPLSKTSYITEQMPSITKTQKDNS